MNHDFVPSPHAPISCSVCGEEERFHTEGLQLCIPVLKRYDLLHNMLMSLDASTVKPAMIHIIDNGRDYERLLTAAAGYSMNVCTPERPMGLAEAWNWFIDNVPEERLICNDDLLFAPESLERILAARGPFVSPLAGTNACSCFLLRDECVEIVGKFDEEISPGYAYYEDCDYVERMVKKKVRITGVDCGVRHIGSQTLASFTKLEMDEHHRRFQIAQSNFIKKWGRLPDLNRPGLYD